MAESKARFLANLIGATSTDNDFTLPNTAISGTNDKVLTSQGDGTVTWEETLTPPQFTSMTGSVNEDDQTTLTINGGRFVAGMTIDVYNNSDTKLNTTSLSSNLVDSTQITVDIPNNTSTNGFPIASGTVIYLKISKSGLTVNTSNITVNADPVWGSISSPYTTSAGGATGNIGSALTAPTISSGSGTITYSIATQPSDGVNKYSINSSRQISVDSTSNSSAGNLASSANPKTDAISVRATGPAGATQASDLAVNIAVYQYAGAGGVESSFTGNGTTGTNNTTYRVHTFSYLASGHADAGHSGTYHDITFQTYTNLDVEYLVIAGGGSGGVWAESSGYTVGNAGNDSLIINSSGTTLVSCNGGGYGGRYSSVAGGNGGSGGGGGGGLGTGGSAITGGVPNVAQGYPGATATQTGSGASYYYNSGGGGGAGEAGSTDGTYQGGDGLSSYITGSSVTRAGGGGGNDAARDINGVGGDGGGGRGTHNGSGLQGTDGTGSGGGAGDAGVGAGHGGGGAGGYKSAVYVGSTGETSGGGTSANSKLSLSPGTYTMRIGAGGARVGSATTPWAAWSGRGGHGIIIIRYAI